MYGGMGIQLPVFLASVLDAGEWLASRPITQCAGGGGLEHCGVSFDHNFCIALRMGLSCQQTKGHSHAVGLPLVSVQVTSFEHT
jgi:hypothetical protein